MEAGEAILVERGFDTTQTPDIAARAGVAVGTFYRYFSDKKEILLEILRRDLDRARTEVMNDLTVESLAGQNRRATLETALAALVANVERKPQLHRLFQEMSLRDPEVAALRMGFDREARARITELIAAICPREEVADPEATAYIIQTAVAECASAISGAYGASPIPRRRAMAALTELVYRSLFGIEH